MAYAAYCRHCGVHKVNRPRGLCWACYYSPAILARYPVDPTFGPKSPDLDVRPAAPTIEADGATLHCICAPRCKSVVKVGPAQLTQAMALRMPWTLCPACTAAVAAVTG